MGELEVPEGTFHTEARLVFLWSGVIISPFKLDHYSTARTLAAPGMLA